MKQLLSYFVLYVSAILIAGCATIFQEYEGSIIGKVILSDNPPTGHGGVLVSTDVLSTTTSSDGSFELEGSITRGGSVDVYFEKQGYATIYYELEFDNFEHSEEEGINIYDLGEVILEKTFTTSVSDNFNDDNADGWTEDTKATYRVENGEYSIESPNDELQHWALHMFEPEGDFSFEVEVRYISGDLNSPYGIGVFNTSETRTCLLISKNGWYELTYYDDSWHEIRGWTASSLIDTTSGNPNKLMIAKNENSLQIYINDSSIGSFSASSVGEVNRIGLYVQDDLHIHFDDVEARAL